MAANIRHSADSPEWYTPDSIVDRARAVMGGIDLDPASHAEANARIRAARYFTEADNGLQQEWVGRTFVNPPGGLVNEFWRKLTNEWPSEWIWVGFSLEQLQTLQGSGSGYHPLEMTYCIPAKRVAYVENRAKRLARERKLREQGKVPGKVSSPSHGSYIVYSGPNTKAFRREFESLGLVVVN